MRTKTKRGESGSGFRKRTRGELRGRKKKGGGMKEKMYFSRRENFLGL